MTVRAWFTISALALLALGAAFAVRVFSPIRPPEMLVSVGDVRLEGVYQGSCWPQRTGELRCEDPEAPPPDDAGPAIPPDDRMRIVAAFPSQPEAGTVRIVDRLSEETVRSIDLDDRIDYDLETGRYLLRVEARYPDDAFVRYAFPFRIGGRD